jgi:hypothetical protein
MEEEVCIRLPAKDSPMSMTTHRFHSVQTMARAQEWLGQIGIPADHIEVCSTGLPSMTVQTDFARLPAVEMIINAAEMTDPEGWPSWGASGHFEIAVAPPPAVEERLHTTPIGWHPID